MCSPTPPSPQNTINQQTASNRETAITQAGLNMVDQTDAAGNKLAYAQNGTWADGTPRYSATQTLGSAGQQLQTTNQGTAQNLSTLANQQSGRLSGLLNAPIDFSNLPSAGKLSTDDFSADRRRVEDAMFERLQPQLDTQRQQFETDLVNRGLRPGSTSYNDQRLNFDRGVNDQRTSILLNAGQEQNRLQQLDMNRANFANNTRSNSLNEYLAQRQLPLNEILALSGQSQVQSPQFASTPSTGVAGTDVGGIINQGYNQQNQQYGQQQSMLGGLFSAGANLLPLAFSDKRLKTNIEDTGERVAGVAVKEWDWKGGGHSSGVIAQELEKNHPELVDNTHPSGFKRVNYMGLLDKAGAA